MTDIYEFEKSCLPQGVAMESPYTSKQWGFINDINSSVYSNNGLTLIQFDLSSIYNSTNLIDISQAFIVLPITYTTVWLTAGGLPCVPLANAWASTGLKSGYFNLVHGGDLQVNGKTVEQFQPNLNAYVGFKLMSQMSQDDLKTYGPTLGMGECIDNFQSLRFAGNANVTTLTGNYPISTAITGAVGGNGISNNSPFPLSGTANFGDQGAQGGEFGGAYNNGYYSRLKKMPDLSGAGAGNTTNLLYSGVGNATQNVTNATLIRNEIKQYFTISNTNYAVWYDLAIVRLGDIFDCMKCMPLLKKYDGILRLYINTGSVVSNVIGTSGSMITSGSGITFTNTCPLIQSSLLALPTSPAAATAMVSALFVANPTNTAISAATGNVNFAASNAAHFMSACRFYYPQVQLKPEKLNAYITQNRSKKVCYTSVLTNSFSNIGANNTISYLVQSGVTNIRGVLIIPFISSNGSAAYAHGTQAISNSIVTFSQMQSPFDTAPMTNGPISLTGLQLTVGGVNMLQNTYSYSFENFIQSVSLYEKINAGDLGLSCGLINQAFWETAYRTYYVDCTRCNIADMMTPRNINLTLTNNSLQTIDILIFTEYFKELTVDVETGLVEV